MDDQRKNAYRYLLYWAMLDIRLVAWIRLPWWNPFAWRQTWRRIHYAGSVADWLHNLAFFASTEFEGFDEEWFWNELHSFERRFGDFDLGRYKSVFDRRLDELNTRTT
ncbi:MAG: hypothetical protein RIC55_24725 [Pirellulaceae bacterium]